MTAKPRWPQHQLGYRQGSGRTLPSLAFSSGFRLLRDDHKSPCARKPPSRGEKWTPNEGHPEGLPVLSFREWYVIVGLIFYQNRPHRRLTGVHQFLYLLPFHPHESWRASQLKVLVVAVLMDLSRRHCGRTPGSASPKGVRPGISQIICETSLEFTRQRDFGGWVSNKRSGVARI